MWNRQFTGLTIAALACGGFIVCALVAAMPAALPGTAGAPSPSSAGVPATRPAATQVTHPGAFNVEKLKLVGLLGDPRFRHAGFISSITMVEGGKQILTCANDGTARLWDGATGQELRRVQYRDGQHEINEDVRSAALLPDGKRLLTCGGKEVTLWDWETGKVLRTMNHDAYVHCMAVSPDGKQAFAGDDKGTIIQWNLETGRKIRELLGHIQWVAAMAISPDGKTLITGSADASIRIWDSATGQALGTLKGHAGEVSGVAFSSDGTKFASVSFDHTVRPWDLAAVLKALPGSARELWRAATPNYSWAVFFSPDGKTLALGGRGFVQLLDGRNGQVLQSIKLADTTYPPHGTFSADGKEVWFADGVVICRWDTATGKRIFPLPGIEGKFASGPIGDLAIAPEGKLLYTGARDGQSICLWDLRRNTLEEVWPIQADYVVGSLQLSSDGQRLLVGENPKAEILDTRTGEAQRQFAGGGPFGDPWFWGPGDKSVVTTSYEAPLQVLNVDNGNGWRVGRMAHPENLATLPRLRAIDRDRRYVLCANPSNVTIWSLAAESEFGDLPADEVNAALWLPAGGPGSRAGSTGLLTASWDGTLKYWQRPAAATQAAVSTEVLAGWMKNLASDDFKVRDEATAKLIEAGLEAASGVEATLAKADLTDAEVVDRVGRVRRGLEKYEVPDRQIGPSLNLGEPLPKLPSMPLAAHPDGQHWAAILDRGAASVVVLGEVTPEGPKELRRLSGEGHGPCGLLFSPDGKTLYVGNGNATISIYRAD